MKILKIFYTDDTTKKVELDKRAKYRFINVSKEKLSSKYVYEDDIEIQYYLKGFYFDVASYDGKPFTLHILPGSDAPDEDLDSFDNKGINYDEEDYIDFGATKIRAIDFDDIFDDAITALNNCMLPIYYIDNDIDELYHKMVFENTFMGLCNVPIDAFIDLPYQINMDDISMDTITRIANNLRNYIQREANVVVNRIMPMVIEKKVGRIDKYRQDNLLRVMNTDN